MHRGLIIDFNSVAAYLANEDAKVQAEFFNTFAKELQATCGTNHHAEMQLAAARRDMKPDACALLSMLTIETH